MLDSTKDTSNHDIMTQQDQTSHQQDKFPSSSSPNYQTRKRRLKSLTESNEEAMKRPHDIVIFAASSSVGKFLVEELALVVDKFCLSSQQQQPEVTNTSMGSNELRDPLQFAQSRRKLSVPRHMDSGISWAIAGRSAVKLSDTLCRTELSTGIKDLSFQVPVILADLNHQKSLLDMCSKTGLVINCAGPYSVEGEALIKACIETSTNYIDLAHEATFIEQVRRSYSDKARSKGVYIINGCGFQSMSAEMGLNFIKQVADGQLDEVKIILNLSDSKALIRPTGSNMQTKSCGIVSWGMWCSLLIEKARETSVLDRLGVRKPFSTQTNHHSDGNSDESRERPHRQLQRKDTQSLVKDIVEFRNRNSTLAWVQLIKGLSPSARKYCLPINSLTNDESQLIRSEMTNYELRKPDLDSSEGWRPIRCTSFISMKSLFEVVRLAIWLILFNFLVKFSFLRELMKYFPAISSIGNVSGPPKQNEQLDRDSLAHIKFCQTFLAYGTPGDDSGDPLEQREKHLKRKQEQLLVSRIVGPEPNHVTTATYAIQAALAVVLEKDHLPPGGGVLTPGAAFSETNIIYQLRRRNIKFEVLKKA